MRRLVNVARFRRIHVKVCGCALCRRRAEVKGRMINISKIVMKFDSVLLM